MPPFHLPQNKCYGVIKYEKLNYSHRILNIQKKKKKKIFFLVREEKVVRAPTRTMSVNWGGGGGQGGSLITIHKEKKHLFTFHVENKLNSHFTWN